MKVNVPPKVRAALYIITSIGSPIMAYLLTVGIIDEPAMVLWAAEVTVVAALAGFNLSDK